MESLYFSIDLRFQKETNTKIYSGYCFTNMATLTVNNCKIRSEGNIILHQYIQVQKALH